MAVAVAASSSIWASLRSSPAIWAFWVAVAAAALTSASLTSISATLIEAASSAAFAAAISSSEGVACASCGRTSRVLAANTVRAVRIVPRCLIVASSRVHEWVDARGRVLGRSLSTFVTLGNKHTNIHTIHSRNNRNICTTSPTLTAQLPENLGLNYTKMYSLSHFAPRSQHTPIPSQKSTIRDRRATASPMTKNGPHEPSNVPLTARQHKRLPRSPPTAGRASTHVHNTA